MFGILGGCTHLRQALGVDNQRIDEIVVIERGLPETPYRLRAIHHYAPSIQVVPRAINTLRHQEIVCVKVPNLVRIVVL